MNRRLSLVASTAALGLGAAAGLTGCAQVTPKLAFGQAYQSTMSAKDLTTKMSIRTSAADLKPLLDAAGLTATQRTGFERGIEQLAKSSITTTRHSSGAGLDSETDLAKLSSRSLISINGAEIDLRVVDQKIFAKADVAKLGEVTGYYKADPQAWFEGAPESVSWLKAGAEGKWLSLALSDITSLLNEAGVSSTKVIDPARDKAIQDKLRSVVENNADFTSSGSADGGSLVTMTLPVKQLVNDLIPIFLDQAKAQASAAPSADASAIPSEAEVRKEVDKALANVKNDAKLSVVSTVDGNALKKMEVDLNQFFGWIDETKLSAKDKADFTEAKTAGLKATLVSEFSTDAQEIAVPSGATVVTKENLKSMTQSSSEAGTFGGTESGSGSAGLTLRKSELDRMLKEGTIDQQTYDALLPQAAA